MLVRLYRFPSRIDVVLAEVCAINRTPMQRRLVTVSLLIGIRQSPLPLFGPVHAHFNPKPSPIQIKILIQSRCRRRKRGSVNAYSHVVAAALLISKAKETKIRVP